ncbi:glycosyltransferase [Solilutibacter silvestris]|uniref:glycosyltransferase n=1 Tax=Solilutibacter silvestris TaxID=1645665 RepID=UPI003D34EC66
MAGQRRHALNVIAWSNGVGLTRDIELLVEALRRAGDSVAVSAIGRGKLRKWSRPILMRLRALVHRLSGRSKFDANLMLEHVRPEDFGVAQRQLFVPNPEWCLPSDVALLPRVDGILAKTRHAIGIFEAQGCKVAYCGFTSGDRIDASVPRERAFFHLAGRSSNKGTQRLIALWQRHPDWPTLTVLQSPRTAQPIEPPAANIVHRIDYIDDAELRRMQNAHRFHLCPSETEGFGHYIVEAMSVGAIVVTTDGEPMNELVTPERGVLVASGRTGTQHLATTYFFDDDAMAAAVERLVAMSDGELDRLGDNARSWYLDNDAGFSGRLQSALESLLG